jgi:hypothetical protein
MKVKGVMKFRKISCRMVTSTMEPMTANAFMGSNYVAVLSPKT